MRKSASTSSRPVGAGPVSEHYQRLFAVAANGAQQPGRSLGYSARRVWLHRRAWRLLPCSQLMQRRQIQPRPDWPAKVEGLGLTFHSHDEGPYWDESACYELTALEVDVLEAAANTLHFLCIDAAEAVIKNGWWPRLGLSEAAVPVILRSWERDDFSLYGRFDLSYDGATPPKLLEYNADTPTALVEAAVAQWFWLEETRAGPTNSIPSTSDLSRPGGNGRGERSISAASKSTRRTP